MVTDDLAGLVDGTKKWSDVWRDVAKSIMNSIKSILSRLLEARISDSINGLFAPKQQTGNGSALGQVGSAVGGLFGGSGDNGITRTITAGNGTDGIAGAANAAVEGLNKVGESATKTGGGFTELLKGFGSGFSDLLGNVGGWISGLFGGGGSGGAGGGGGWMSAITSIIGMFFHQGGIVGSGGRAQLVNPALFQNALRYHSGGVPGIKANEIPAILQRGEEVITRRDPRHILNGGKVSTMQAPQVNVRNVNVLDPNMAEDYLRSSRGEQVIINAIQRNAGSIRTVLGG